MKVLRTRRRKGVAGTLATVVALVVATGALAYYYAAASAGNGQAAAASLAAVTVDVEIEAQAGDPEAALYPGDTADLTVTATAPVGWPANRRARIGSMEVTSVDGPVGCDDPSWFTVDDSSTNLPGFVLGSTPLAITGATITFNDLEVDQSACAGSNLDIEVTLNPAP